LEEADQGVEVRGEEILASEMGDDAPLDLVPFPIRFHQSEVFVAAIGSLDGAQEQARPPDTLHIKHRRSIVKRYL